MFQLEINGINLPVNPTIHTWEELLQELESKHLGRGKVIASVHFNGNEVLQYRDVDNLSRPLSSIGELKVKAVPMEEMVKEAIQQAENYLVTLQTSIVDVAETFRHQLADRANSNLSEIFEGIKMFVALLQGIELSLSGNYQTGPTSVQQVLNDMGPTLESLIDSQKQKDWILVADILEFELLANLSSLEQTIQGSKQKMGLA